jgi:hypothetical protein
VNLYLDTEFNGHGGDLISLALAADDGKHWYGVWQTWCTDQWVIENVVPNIGVVSGGPGTVTVMYAQHPDMMRFSLKEYLLRDPVPPTIWADWPADFEYLMHLMCGPTYGESFMVACEMRLIATPEGEPKPETPHNALSDAIALMQWHRSLRS